jgi:hypothetical protein
MFKSVYCTLGTLGVLFDYSLFCAILSAVFARHLDLEICFCGCCARRCVGGRLYSFALMIYAQQLPAAGKITQKVSSFISGGKGLRGSSKKGFQIQECFGIVSTI